MPDCSRLPPDLTAGTVADHNFSHKGLPGLAFRKLMPVRRTARNDAFVPEFDDVLYPLRELLPEPLPHPRRESVCRGEMTPEAVRQPRAWGPVQRGEEESRDKIGPREHAGFTVAGILFVITVDPSRGRISFSQAAIHRTPGWAPRVKRRRAIMNSGIAMSKRTNE